eukprot:TRINITY_DN16198_c0_g1_i1.p3 TRINITY_DN16198_c0_g1~~TRINITY_DN16198_c0_g1_i1.p3  ORF type:complete len:61 (-),score=6.78 TRINITY_DN16198_c0_g1_i1:46-228(-)
MLYDVNLIHGKAAIRNENYKFLVNQGDNPGWINHACPSKTIEADAKRPQRCTSNTKVHGM